MARNIAQKLNEAWAQPVVVENRTGAGGIIGADAVAKSAPDGYTYLVGTTTTAINASLVVKSPYDMQRDLQPVAMLSFYPMAAVVPAASPVRSLQDLVALSHKQALTAGSGGNGTPQHLVLEMFKGATGAKILHVPYKGGAPALVALLGAQNDVVFSLWPECLPHVKGGKLRALAVTSEARLAQMPDIPTTAEAGFPGVVMITWYGLFGPAGMPKALTDKWQQDVAKALALPDMKERIESLAGEPGGNRPEEFGAYIKDQLGKMGKLVKDADVKAE